MKMRRVYCAGPYDGDGVIKVLSNIRQGLNTTRDLLVSHNFATFVPWFDWLWGLLGDMPKELYQQQSLAWLDGSEAVFVLPGWESSGGTRREIARASEIGIPVFFELEKLLEWREKIDAEEVEA